MKSQKYNRDNDKIIHSFVFELREKNYLYDYKNDFACIISSKLKKVLERYYAGVLEEENSEEKEVLDFLLKKNYIASDISRFNIVEEEYSTVHMSFAPVYSCNFRCKYCFGQYGEKYNGAIRKFSKKKIKEIIDYFVFEKFPNALNYHIDFVSGGEPLLDFDVITYTVIYAEELQKKKNKNIKIWLCTNSALLDSRICKFLDDHNISIGISIDGVKEIHDKNRRDKNGNGTYDLVIGRVKEIFCSKEYSSNFKSMTALSVIADSNYDIVKNFIHNYRLGFRNLQFKFVRNDRHDFSYLQKEYDKLSEFLLKEYTDKKYDVLLAVLNDNDYFGKIFKRILIGNKVCRRCGAGRNKFCVCPDGSIYPCDSFVGMEKFKIGHINKKQFDNSLFINMDVDMNTICKECKVKYICGGDCYYNSVINTSVISMPDSSFCKIQKYIIEVCIELRIEMEILNPSEFARFKKMLLLREKHIKYI